MPFPTQSITFRVLGTTLVMLVVATLTMRAQIQHASPNAAQTPPSNPPTSGPNLGETLTFLTRIMGDGSVKASHIPPKSRYPNMAFEVDISQSWITQGGPSACFLSWVVTSTGYHPSGRATAAAFRSYLSLPDLIVSEVTGVDSGSWAVTGRGGEAYKFDGADYSGYVLVLKQRSSSVDFGSIPNPSNTSGWPTPADYIFFADQETAERGRKALLHAAELCGAKADPF